MGARGGRRRARWDSRLFRLLRAPSRDMVARRWALERTLHRGAVEGVSVLALELTLISRTVDDARVAARLDAAQSTIHRALDDLRRVGAAIYPSVLAGAGIGAALQAVAERLDLRLRLDLPEHDLGAEARARTGLLVADHLHTLAPGTAVRVRVRGRRLVRVHIIDERPGRSAPRHHRAALRCA
ncbi:hypothetical protein [Actinokineospora sp. NPDC004072]